MDISLVFNVVDIYEYHEDITETKVAKKEPMVGWYEYIPVNKPYEIEEVC